LRAQRRNSTGFPFDRPHQRKAVSGTLVGALATAAPGQLSIDRSGVYEQADMEKLEPTMDTNARLAALFAAIFAAAALRLVPHPPNFAPIAAMALFAGAQMPRKTLSFIAPFAALLLSDAVIGFYSGAGFVYFSFAATVLIGWAIASRKSPLTIALASISSSVLFFVVTNFGVWTSGTMYPHSLAGLENCYVAAIPFFRNTLAGDLVYAALLFGGFALAERLVPAIRPAPAGALA
jgi:hypothetical protein